MSRTIRNKAMRLEVTCPIEDGTAARLGQHLGLRLSALLEGAIGLGYTIEVGQRINPLAPRGAVTVATVRRARGNY